MQLDQSNNPSNRERADMSLRILLCSGRVPFMFGGAERLLDSLKHQLSQRGHSVDVVQLPFTWHSPESVVRSYAAWRVIELGEVESGAVDLVITLKFPAHVVEHSNKTVWLIQQFRQVYDLYGTPHSLYDPTSSSDIDLRDTVRAMDTRTLGEARLLFAISHNVAQRLKDHNGLTAKVVHPPPPLDGQFYASDYGDYVLTIARLDELKRTEHLIYAISLTRSPVRCLVAGDGPDRRALQRLAAKLGVDHRVVFLGSVSDNDLLRLYSEALAVFYAPLDEDYGFVTVEAMKSARPVLTYSDSGGVLEFVQDGITGFVTSSGDTGAMAERIDSLYQSKADAKRIGENARDRVTKLTWDNALYALLGG